MPPEDATLVKAVNHEEEKDKKSLGCKKVTKATIANGKPQSKIAKVKKEEPEADDSPTAIKPASSASRSKQLKVKKEEPEDSADEDDKPLAKRRSIMNLKKEPKKKKKIKEEEKKKKGSSAGQKRQKRVYDLPGQKRDPPEEKDPLRIFYETLHKQVPHSEMAQLWMMESGLLPKELAMKVHEKKVRKGSPVKAATATKNRSQSATVKKKTRSTPEAWVNKKKDSTQKQSKKRKVEDDSDADDDDEFILPKAKKRKEA